jgi:hypothetical protein
MIDLGTSVVLARRFADGQLVGRIHLVEMAAPARTRNAMRLAAIAFLRGQGVASAWATVDQRRAEAAVAEGFALVDC